MMLFVTSSDIKAVCQSVREATMPPAWRKQPLDWQTPLNVMASLPEADHYAKQLKRTQKYINFTGESVFISMGNSCNYYIAASSGV